MNNKIQNPKVVVPNDLELNEENYLNDILASLKNLVVNYAYALNESSNSYYYNIVKQIFDETSLLQRSFFDALFQRGWYCLEVSDNTKVIETINKLQPKLSEMR